jgi:hypothetical protein
MDGLALHKMMKLKNFMYIIFAVADSRHSKLLRDIIIARRVDWDAGFDMAASR